MTLFTLLSTNHATMLDYSSSHYIPISDGYAAIYENYGILAHITNLTDFITISRETKNLTDLLPQSHMKKLLEGDADQILKMIKSLRIHHRNARSLNSIGTALKYIAGTPDYDDFAEVRDKQSELITASNAQITINTDMQLQINNLTRTLNTLLNTTKTREIDTGHLYDLLNGRNRAIIRELDNIALSVTLGKLQMINPILLDSSEVNFILETEKRVNVSIAEVIVNSKLKVLQDENIITFLIKFPKIKYLCYKKLIFPVAHENKMLSFESNEVAKCNTEYVMLTNCKKKSTISFCQKICKASNVCLNNLLNNYKATCGTISAHKVPPILEIDDGIVIINDQSFNLTYQNETKTVQKGTFLITFESEIQVNSSKFENLRKIAFRSPETPIAHSVSLAEHTAILSLPYLHELNINNREHISNLHSKIQATHYISASLLVLILAICAAYIYMKKQRKMQITNVLLSYDQTRTPES